MAIRAAIETITPHRLHESASQEVVYNTPSQNRVNKKVYSLMKRTTSQETAMSSLVNYLMKYGNLCSLPTRFSSNLYANTSQHLHSSNVDDRQDNINQTTQSCLGSYDKNVSVASAADCNRDNQQQARVPPISSTSSYARYHGTLPRIHGTANDSETYSLHDPNSGNNHPSTSNVRPLPSMFAIYQKFEHFGSRALSQVHETLPIGEGETSSLRHEETGKDDHLHSDETVHGAHFRRDCKENIDYSTPYSDIIHPSNQHQCNENIKENIYSVHKENLSYRPLDPVTNKYRKKYFHREYDNSRIFSSSEVVLEHSSMVQDPDDSVSSDALVVDNTIHSGGQCEIDTKDIYSRHSPSNGASLEETFACSQQHKHIDNKCWDASNLDEQHEHAFESCSTSKAKEVVQSFNNFLNLKDELMQPSNINYEHKNSGCLKHVFREIDSLNHDGEELFHSNTAVETCIPYVPPVVFDDASCDTRMSYSNFPRDMSVRRARDEQSGLTITQFRDQLQHEADLPVVCNTICGISVTNMQSCRDTKNTSMESNQTHENFNHASDINTNDYASDMQAADSYVVEDVDEKSVTLLSSTSMDSGITMNPSLSQTNPLKTTNDVRVEIDETACRIETKAFIKITDHSHYLNNENSGLDEDSHSYVEKDKCFIIPSQHEGNGSDDCNANSSFETSSKEYFNNSWFQAEDLLTTPEKVLCNSESAFKSFHCVNTSGDREIENKSTLCSAVEPENESGAKDCSNNAYQNSMRTIKLKTTRTLYNMAGLPIHSGASSNLKEVKNDTVHSNMNPLVIVPNSSEILDQSSSVSLESDGSTVKSFSNNFKSSIHKHNIRYKFYSVENKQPSIQKCSPQNDATNRNSSIVQNNATLQDYFEDNPDDSAEANDFSNTNSDQLKANSNEADKLSTSKFSYSNLVSHYSLNDDRNANPMVCSKSLADPTLPSIAAQELGDGKENNNIYRNTTYCDTDAGTVTNLTDDCKQGITATDGTEHCLNKKRSKTYKDFLSVVKKTKKYRREEMEPNQNRG